MNTDWNDEFKISKDELNKKLIDAAEHILKDKMSADELLVAKGMLPLSLVRHAINFSAHITLAQLTGKTQKMLVDLGPATSPVIMIIEPLKDES